MLQCRRRRLDVLDRDAVPYCCEDGVDVLLDAVLEELRQLGIVAELRYFGQDVLLERAGYVAEPTAESRDDFRR